MAEIIPTEINLRKRSRILSISFSDGAQFDLPCQYLRVFSRAAEHLALQNPVVGKDAVNIDKIEPQGSYGLRLYFDDGHDTGIYSFETLYRLGRDHDSNWSAYLSRLAELDGDEAAEAPHADGIAVTVALLDWLGELLDCEELTLDLSGDDCRVEDALDALRTRPGRFAELLRDDLIELEIDYEEVSLDSPLEAWDELVIRPVSSTPPKP